MQVSPKTFRTLAARRITFAAFLPVELTSTDLETKGKEVMTATWEAVSGMVKPPPSPATRDDDGDWSITWESGRSQFSLDLQKRVVGATFTLWADPKVAADLAKSHAATAFEKLGIRKISALFIRYNTVFVLPEGKTNHELILSRLFGSTASGAAVATVVTDRERIGRFDVKFSYRIDDAHYVFIKVELPANREKRTVWIELAVRTEDDLTVAIPTPDSQSNNGLGDFMKVANDFYQAQYATFVSHVLGNLEVDLLEQPDD